MKITDKKGVKVTPEMIGLFFEDINFAADGKAYLYWDCIADK